MLEASIMKLLSTRHQEVNGQPLHAVDWVNLSKIVMKLSRLASTPWHTDSWHDIGGYAVLIEQSLTDTNKEE